MEQYENPIEHACSMQLGQTFICNGWSRPEGFCESAWDTVSPFVMTLAHGGQNIYDGWMKNPRSAMISCNDGFRPVNFLLETFGGGGKFMKEKINITEYANLITEALPKGILLNTNGDKFNSMVIGWGHIGTLWSRPTFHVYVRQGRYTKGQLDKTGEFTVSVPLEKPIPVITKICGGQSGFNIDKVKEAGLTLEKPECNNTPGVREYPLTIECKILYAQDQDLAKIPEDIREKMYPQDVPGTNPMANRDAHTMFVGQIMDAYIIKD